MEGVWVSMAKLKGEIRAARGSEYTSCSRLSDSHIISDINTWNGRIQTVVKKDGSFRIVLNNQEIAVGNLDRNEAYLGDAANGNAAGSGGEFTPLKDAMNQIEEVVDEYRRVSNASTT